MGGHLARTSRAVLLSRGRASVQPVGRADSFRPRLVPRAGLVFARVRLAERRRHDCARAATADASTVACRVGCRCRRVFLPSG